MKILVSACLLGENCKYDGGNNYHEAVAALASAHELVPVCPEVFGGLPTPRTPSELVEGTAMSRDGHNVDAPFRKGAHQALETALREGAGLAILQPRSPSCGVHEIYDGTFTGRKVPGKGVFAALLEQHGIPAIEPDEIPACRHL